MKIRKENSKEFKTNYQLFAGETVTLINPYITFSSPNTFTLNVVDNIKYWNGTLEYSTDTTNWNIWDGTTTISAQSDGTKYNLYIRGSGNGYITGSDGNITKARWILTGSNISCEGNIENLLDYQTVALGNHPTMANRCYQAIFFDCTSLTTAPELPATTLASYCYNGMFYGCTSLTEAPELPATTLATYCYRYMFYGCESLTTAPTLSATILTTGCYYKMFAGCTSLTEAPELLATTLAGSCYRYMFEDCTNIKLSETQTGNYTKEFRIPKEGTGTDAATSGLTDMFTNTGGTFTGTPSLNTTYYLWEDPAAKSVLLHPTSSPSITLLPQGIPDASKQEKMQYGTMPEATSEREGKIYQYTGTSTEAYTNGYFYKCVEGSLGYEWVNVFVQPYDSGTDVMPWTVIKEEESLPTATAASPDFVEVSGVTYGKLQLINLTGTTWLINNTPTDYPNKTFKINFESNSVDYNQFRIEGSYGPTEFNPDMGLYYRVTGQAEVAAYNRYDGTWADNNYKTIIIEDGDDITNDALYSWLISNAQLSSGVPVIGYQYEIINCGEVEETTNLEVNRLFRTEYTITTSVTNGTYEGDESIWTEETAEVTISPDDDYTLPSSITVTGASYTYDSMTGVVNLSNATGNVTISVTCESISSGYSGNITTYESGYGTSTRIKFDTPPSSDNDYDTYVDMYGTITGSTTYTNKMKVYVWGSSYQVPKIKINNTEYNGSNNYSTATEVVLNGDYDIYLGYAPDIG